MKLLALTSALTAAASTAFAGSVAFVAPVSPEMVVEETGSMGGSGLWLIPLILIALIFFAGQNGSSTENGETYDPYK
jgi:ABC-type enterobactin transport system permease subunit